MFKGLGSFLLPRIKGITDKLFGNNDVSPKNSPAPKDRILATGGPNGPSPNDPMFNRKLPQLDLVPKAKAVSPPPSQTPTPTSLPTQVLGAQTPSPQPVGGLVTRGRNPTFNTVKPSPDVIDAINTAATTHQVPAQLLYDIGLQESSLYPKKVNPNAAVGLNPSGLFQFTDETWRNILDKYNNKPGMSLHLPNTDRFDPKTNAMAAAYLIKHGQLGKWDASEDVWGNFWTPQELEQMGFYKQSVYHTPGMRSSVRLTGGKKK